jgi:hypothetical protein
MDLHKTLVRSKEKSNVHEAHTLRDFVGLFGVRSALKVDAGSNSYCLIRCDGDGSGNMCGLSVYDGTRTLFRREGDGGGLRYM